MRCLQITISIMVCMLTFFHVADQYIGVDFWYAANLKSGMVKHIPKPHGIYYYACLSVDTRNNTLLAIEAETNDPGHVNYLNSFDMTTGDEMHIMNVSSVAMLSGDSHTYDGEKQVLYTLTLDWDRDVPTLQY